MMGYEKRYQAVLAILRDHAPDAKAQELCSKILRDMEADDLHESEIETNLVTCLSDGLRFGSWPWVIMPGFARKSNT